MRPEWTAIDVTDLVNVILKFKEVATNMLQKDHALELKTTEWHILNHLVIYLNQIGDISYTMADFYEGSQNRFKENYKSTSKRKFYGMNGTLSRCSTSWLTVSVSTLVAENFS